MNTKTEQISSGLVAVAWLDHNINTTDRGQLCFVEAQPRAVDYMAGYRCDALVRLSDAEAIISAKDAEIERLAKESTGYAANLRGKHSITGATYQHLQTTVSKQAERIKELEADLSEDAHIRDRMSQLLAETAVALKGPEKALHRHGWQDLPDIAAKQSAALKLARKAITNELQPCVCANGCSFCAGKVSLEQALAAIDALKGE